MTAKLFVLITIAISLSASASNGRGQEPDDATGARSAFLESRHKAPTATGRKPGKGTSPSNHQSRPPLQGKAVNDPNMLSAVGIGYTIYRKSDQGLVNVRPSTVFHAEDQIRIVLEPNSDGYLYVFHTENGQMPEMIFPDARLNAGDNRVKAHVPYEVPSSRESDERFRWFLFDQNPATERLYFVVTKNHLPGVPVGPELISYCRTYATGCPWRPVRDVWDLVRRSLDAPVRSSVSKAFNEEQQPEEREAIDRGLGLPTGAPEPSVVRLSASPGAQLLVTVVDLIHR